MDLLPTLGPTASVFDTATLALEVERKTCSRPLPGLRLRHTREPGTLFGVWPLDRFDIIDRPIMKRVRHILFNSLTAISLVLALATAGTWGISQRREHWFHWYGRSIEISGSADASEMRLSFYWPTPRDPPPRTYGFVFQQPILEEFARWSDISPYGWTIATRTRLLPGLSFVSTWSDSVILSRDVYIDFVFMTGLFLLLPLGWLVVRLRTRRLAHARGHCSACGYDLRANPARCSECGQVVLKND